MKKPLLTTFACAASLLFAHTAHAEIALSGTYTIGDGSDGNSAVANPDGTWHLTGTSATFSYVAFIPDQTVTFAQLANVNAVFSTNAGDNGDFGGSPRISIGLNTGSGEAFLHIALGNAPNYNDGDVVLNTYSGFNVIGNNDTGRYDDSQFGGSPFTQYDNVLALIGNANVEEIDFVTDSFDAHNHDLTLTSINAAAAEAPEPASMGLIMVGLAGLAVIRRRKVR